MAEPGLRFLTQFCEAYALLREILNTPFGLYIAALIRRDKHI